MVAAIEVDSSRVPVPGGVIERISTTTPTSAGGGDYGRSRTTPSCSDDNLRADHHSSAMPAADTFQVGQVYQSFRDGRNRQQQWLEEEDYFETT